MDTLSSVVNALQAKGYTSEILPNEFETLISEEWHICEIHRFEGNSSPSDNSILYAIRKKDGSRKSLVIDAYGVHSDACIDKFLCGLEQK
ncbi:MULTISPECIES: phosphoribosylpyrophosphate synthetase [unclassified Flavobacterium]|uniref:phosphoribosylpyrophosphate synthetase n=1 Tax=unclassified Flavobacterium TaxID=196869 RepID=UPI00131CD3BE|nr:MULTISPECIES: phosphoribosylpyrophosphate synthetase [unclassified Flavobacterium]